MEFVSINPFTEKKEKSYKGHSLSECKKIISESGKEQKEWKNTSFTQRKKLLKKVAQALRKRKNEFGKLITTEMGKPITQAIAEIEKCALASDFYADNAKKFLEDEHVKTENKKSFARFEPLGVVLAIMPWNFPFWQVFRFAAPAIMAGNTGVLKHASNVPGCAIAIEEVFLEAGFPKNVFRTLLTDSKTAQGLISQKEISAVTVTGSTNAGSQIALEAGKNIKKCVLELGGSDPFIVLDDVDVKECSQEAVNGRMVNMGQSCIAAKRFIVQEKILKEFEKEFAQKMESLSVGDPMDPKTQVGPLARKDLVNAVHEQMTRSVKMGAKVLAGGKKHSGKGFFFYPTVLGNVSVKMPVFSEETFGPLAGVMKAKNDLDAAMLANRSEYGLGASIWTKNPKRAEKLVPLIESGNVFVNKTVASDPRLPFGGIKKSGFGRELGVFGIREFTNVKTVVVK